AAGLRLSGGLGFTAQGEIAIRILIVNSVLGYGSTGRICLDVAQLARENGHQCVVAYGRGPKVETHVRFSGVLGVAWHGVLTRLLDRHGLGSRWATLRLFRFIRSFQ